MTARELFGVCVRTIGLLAIASAAWNSAGLIMPAPGFSRVDYLVPMLPVILIGAVCFFAAETVVSAAYGARDSDDDSPVD